MLPAKNHQPLDGTHFYSTTRTILRIDLLQEKWGVNTTDRGIRKHMTHKCTDYSRYAHERSQKKLLIELL